MQSSSVNGLLADRRKRQGILQSGCRLHKGNGNWRNAYMQPFGKEKQVFISHSSKDKKDVEMIIPYLNGQDLPVWFDKYSIPVGASITEQVQRGIEESDMVIFWVTDNFLNSNWCQMEMKAYISRMIQENIRICIVMGV